MRVGAAALVWGMSACVWAKEPERKAEIHGDLKSFFVGTFPYDNDFYKENGVLPADPTAQGTLDGRLKFSFKTESVQFLAHHAVTTQTAPIGRMTGQTGLGIQAPQLVELGWRGFKESDSPESMSIQGRTDRLSVSGDVEFLTWKVGRQPITLGHGLGFTPMDLVNPFLPTMVDQEYKPGVDAVSADLFFGTSTKASLIAAYTEDQLISEAEAWAVDGMVYAAYGQHTFGHHDVGILLAEVRGDEVIGLTLATYAGPVGIHGDVTYTRPDDVEEEAPFIRGVAGCMWTATEELTLIAELYHQTLGVTDPEGYLSQLEGDRYRRGELWLAGTTYGSTSILYQLTPLMEASTTIIANMLDSSALLAPGLIVSVSDEVELVVGGFIGVGQRPDDISLVDILDPQTGFPLQGDALNSSLGVNSEFGLYPSSAHLQMKAYF